MGNNNSHTNGGGHAAIAIQERAICENPNAGPDGAGWRADGAAYTLEARTVPQAVATPWAVRRLMPIECLRLQGFPDGHTATTYGGDPFLSLYAGPSIINWDTDFFVLDETHMARLDFKWEEREQHRVLEIQDGRYIQSVHNAEGEIVDVTPSRQGGGFLDFVPFTVASAKDMGPQIEMPPLGGVARAAKAMYQLSADYRHQLFMSGQETLVAINGDAPDMVGAGVVHQMNGSEKMVPDLKYVSPTCSGIDAHRVAIGENRDAAAAAGARLFEQAGKAQESGEARALRFRSETANLQSVLQMSCSLLESGMRHAAMMQGLDPKDIAVNAPTDLLDAAITPEAAKALWEIVQERGLSYETFYDAVQKGGLASPGGCWPLYC